MWTTASLLLGFLACNASAPTLQEGAQGGAAARPRLSPSRDAAPVFDEADLSERETPVVRAVRRAADSVVSIYVLTRDEREARWRGTNLEGQGSGVIVDPAGLTITNWHVVASAVARPSMHQIQARLKDGRNYVGRVLNVSKDNDLALLQLQLDAGEEVKPVVVGDSDSLMVGETLVAIGNPQGNANSVTAGVLSATKRTIRARAPTGEILELRDLLQTDAAINQGNSGGALLDITGKLIGINNAMAQGAENIGFAIPVNTVQRVFRELLIGSANFSMWLGMQVDEQDGVLQVAAVYPDGPAARAGLRAGDRVTAAGGRQIGSTVDYARALLDAAPGRPFPLTVQRGSSPLRVDPVPLTQAQGAVLRGLGVEVEEVRDSRVLERASRAFSQGLRTYYRLPSVLRVTEVRRGGPADEIGVEAGDVLLNYFAPAPFGGRRRGLFENLEMLAEIVQMNRGSELPIAVLRDGDVLDGAITVR